MCERDYRQNGQYEQQHREEKKTRMYQVTIKSNIARTIYTKLEIVGQLAGETGHGQVRRAWALFYR